MAGNVKETDLGDFLCPCCKEILKLIEITEEKPITEELKKKYPHSTEMTVILYHLKQREKRHSESPTFASFAR